MAEGEDLMNKMSPEKAIMYLEGRLKKLLEICSLA
jgi:hypothetical protein